MCVPEDEIIELFHIPTEWWIARPDNARNFDHIRSLDRYIMELQSQYGDLENTLSLLEAIRVEFYKQIRS